jgi:phospholipase/carboxylesterase
MDTVARHYTAGIHQAEEKLLLFLRRMEAYQEALQMARLDEQRQGLEDTTGDLFNRLKIDLASLTPPDHLKDFHTTFSKAVEHCAAAYGSFVSAVGRDFAIRFLKGRFILCQAKHLLYHMRAELPLLQQYWVLPDALPTLAALESRTPDVDVPVGLIRHEPTDDRYAYSLYVPENYTPQKTWPLIVCLHGGYSRDDDYILTWLRIAKSKGYLLLSPKSSRETWSAIRTPGTPPNPITDLRSIRLMLDEVWETYAVDRGRIYATGFSDGGIFTHILGLSFPDLFTGIAPIASQLHTAVDNMLRRGRGTDLPILLVHGEKDPIFSIDFARQTRQLLDGLGYPLTFHEVPNWGHAYPYSINETVVLPWFESLEVRPTA